MIDLFSTRKRESFESGFAACTSNMAYQNIPTSVKYNFVPCTEQTHDFHKVQQSLITDKLVDAPLKLFLSELQRDFLMFLIS